MFEEERENPIFKIGDRVVAVEAVDGRGDLIGKAGTVVDINSNFYAPIGVEFDSIFDGGHDCKGHGILGRCRYGEETSFIFEAECDSPEINPDTEEVAQLDSFLESYKH